MNFDTIVHGRRSIRGYKPDPFPQDVLEEIIEIATRTPSSMNTQPWHLHVISGEPLNRIRAGNTERNLAGVPPSREFRVESKYEGVNRDRQVKVAVQLFEAMGIMQSPVVREHAGIPENHVIQTSVAMGYPDYDIPANTVVSTRRPVEDVATFIGFNDES
jgi:Nitroreductase family